MNVVPGAQFQAKREAELKSVIARRWEAGKKDRLELGRDLHELQEMLAGKGRDGEFAPWLRLQGIPRTLAYYYISLITNEKCQDFDTSELKEADADDCWQSTASPEWRTPQHVVELVNRCLRGIDLDPCSDSRDDPNVPATHVFTAHDDGLRFDWYGKIYMPQGSPKSGQ